MSDREWSSKVKGGMRGIDSVLIRSLLDACASCGRPDIWERTYQLGYRFSWFEFGLLIKCYSWHKDLDMALDVKKRMETWKVDMNPVIFGALIDLCLKKADSCNGCDNWAEKYYKLAEGLFHEMETLGIAHSIISLSLKIKYNNKISNPE